MGRGFLAASLANSVDEAIVVVKLLADEDAVTYLRRKPVESCMEAEAKGGTWDRVFKFQNNWCCEISQDGAVCGQGRIPLS